MKKISISIYEDDSHYQEGLKWLLATDDRFEVVGMHSIANNILADLERLIPDIIVIDLHMPPGISGIEAIRIIRQSGYKIPALVLTGLDDDDSIIDAIQVGANGYLVKTKAGGELIDAIFMVLNGGAPMSPNIATKVLAFIQEKSKKRQPEFEANLTKREKEILQSLTQGNSHKMIAASLNIEILTVRNHLRHIYEKLRVHSGTEAVAIALKYGLVISDKI
jgi:DNA-binding NarL/FixJ family response regulator